MYEFKVPFLSYEDIRGHANAFLSTYNPSGELPVDIEHIIEVDLRITLKPILSLKEAFNTLGFISRDFRSISVDLHIFNNVENMCRFTLAHELGHMILHRNLVESFEFSNTYEWKEAVFSINEKQYQYLETQANKFAGLVLVPSPQLNEMFEEAKSKALEKGFVLNDESDVVYGYIHRAIAQEFNVSEEAVRYRCSYENLR